MISALLFLAYVTGGHFVPLGNNMFHCGPIRCGCDALENELTDDGWKYVERRRLSVRKSTRDQLEFASSSICDLNDWKTNIVKTY